MRRYIPIIRRLTAAGWEPISYARADDPAVQIERFGGTNGRPLLLTVRSAAKEEKAVRLSLEPPLPAPAKATELVEGLSCQIEGRHIIFSLPPARVFVLAVEGTP